MEQAMKEGDHSSWLTMTPYKDQIFSEHHLKADKIDGYMNRYMYQVQKRIGCDSEKSKY